VQGRGAREQGELWHLHNMGIAPEARPLFQERVYVRGVVCEKIRRAEEHPNT
jgi:hypothetical protein